MSTLKVYGVASVAYLDDVSFVFNRWVVGHIITTLRRYSKGFESTKE